MLRLVLRLGFAAVNIFMAGMAGGHSQIIVQKDSNGFTVLQGGLSASPYRNERYYTWSEYLNSWNYAYIKYIKWPGAPAYSGGTVPGKPMLLGYEECIRL